MEDYVEHLEDEEKAEGVALEADAVVDSVEVEVRVTLMQVLVV